MDSRVRWKCIKIKQVLLLFSFTDVFSNQILLRASIIVALIVISKRVVQ